MYHLLYKNFPALYTADCINRGSNVFLDNVGLCGMFMYLSKACDRINHNILLKNLEKCGIRGNALLWFKNGLENRYQTVKITDKNGYATLSDL